MVIKFRGVSNAEQIKRTKNNGRSMNERLHEVQAGNQAAWESVVIHRQTIFLWTTRNNGEEKNSSSNIILVMTIKWDVVK